MTFSDDAVLQAAAMIVSAQISAKLFNVDMSERGMVSSALATALEEVKAGCDAWNKETKRGRKPLEFSEEALDGLSKLKRR